jgi:hypothetical protein
MKMVFLYQFTYWWLYNPCDTPLSPHPTTHTREAHYYCPNQNIEPIGMFFFVPSMVCLILALQWEALPTRGRH